MNKSLLTKLVVSIVFVVVTVMMAGIFIEIRHQTQFMKDVLEFETEQLINSFESILTINDLSNTADLQDKVYRFVLNNPEVVAIDVRKEVGNGEEIIASNDLRKIGNLVSKAYESEEEEHGINLMEVSLFGGDEIVALIPWHILEKHVGSYEVTISILDMKERFTRQVYESAFVVFLSGLSLLGLVIVVLKKGLIDRIRNVVDGVKKYGSGDLTHRLKVFTNDEIGLLSSTFNEMAERVQSSQQKLETEVDEKTKLLNEQIDKFKEQAEDQEMGKRAMINLLEDAKELEEEIKREKAGVEKKVEERTAELKAQAQALEDARQRATAGWVQLQAEKARLNASMEALPLGLVILDAEHMVVACNETVKKVAADVVSNDCNPEEFGEFISKLNINLVDTCPHCNDGKTYENQSISYGNKYLRVIAVPVKNEDEIIGSTYLFEDITEAKRLQKTRDEFFSVASHELRTPLTAIRGNTQMLTDYYPEVQNNNEIKEMVDDIHNASKRLIAIVNDFLDASRLEMKKMDLKIENVSMKELIQKVMKDVTPKSFNKELGYELNLDENDEYIVAGDRDRLEQVFLNLVGNAIKFTNEGGIYIKLSRTNHDSVKVEVTDTGVGISDEDQTELFQKFKQVGSNAGLARDVSQGTGMGLYISKLIMQAMGGRIYLKSSEKGKGSTFAFEVPIGK